MKQQATNTKAAPKTNPLLNMAKAPNGMRRSDYKVGNLFFQYISNSSIANSGQMITGAHVAEILEAQGFIETFRRFGQTYYRWVAEQPSKSDFFRTILPKAAT